MNEKIIFDFDGVILDTNHIKKNAFLETYKNADKDLKKKISNYHLNNLGVNRYNKIEYIEKNIFKNKNWKLSKIKKINKFSKIVIKKVLKSRYIPGSLNLIKKLNHNYELYICSATPQKELKIICKEKKIHAYFTKIYGSPKSKLENLKKIIKQNKNSLNNIIYFGDADSDYIIAQKLKIKFVSVNNKKINEFMKILNVKNLKNFRKIHNFISK